MLKKVGYLFLIVLSSIIIASIYGILHNQISYSISSEYYTEFKFSQIGEWLHQVEKKRIAISFVGFLATWWFGLIFGILNGLIGIFQKTTKLMFKAVSGATFRTLIFSMLFGFLGLILGFKRFGLAIDWNTPPNLEYPSSFLAVGTMHTFSYVGGIIGLFYGVKYQLRIKKASVKQ